MPSGPVDHRPDLRLAWVLGTVVVASALAPVVVALVFGDRLPAEVPRHYGADGQPTALWGRWVQVTFIAAVTVLVGGGWGLPQVWLTSNVGRRLTGRMSRC
ncbi:MAG: DUF1648 domain-containing protein, partial [Nitriliruptoraceae bacterium]|nr:DUF1648 domain-containing protein [Nitriliruptoraceae bacterium]